MIDDTVDPVRLRFSSGFMIGGGDSATFGSPSMLGYLRQAGMLKPTDGTLPNHEGGYDDTGFMKALAEHGGSSGGGWTGHESGDE